jgi:hypothetical protein
MARNKICHWDVRNPKKNDDVEKICLFPQGNFAKSGIPRMFYFEQNIKKKWVGPLVT